MANDTQASGFLTVCVCYALPEAAWQREITLPAGATVADALSASGFQAAFPAVQPWANGVGVFGKECEAHTVVLDGARVEIYRKLCFDPKESRRRRAEHRRLKAARATKGGKMRPAGLL